MSLCLICRHRRFHKDRMCLIARAKNGISFLTLSRQLGISQNSAWLMKQKQIRVVVEREAEWPLAGSVPIDDAHWDGLLCGRNPSRMYAFADADEWPQYRRAAPPDPELSRYDAEQCEGCDSSEAFAALSGDSPLFARHPCPLH
jgi:hypothetical protein